MNQQNKMGISYELTAAPISAQLKKLGIKFDKSEVTGFERQLQALHLLRFGAKLVKDGTVTKITKRLHRRVVEHVGSFNKLNFISA